MTTIRTIRTAHWDICRHRCFEKNDRQIKTAGGTELQGQLHQGREDAYWIRTVSGRPFHQLWIDKELQRGFSSEAITDRHKLRPLVDPKDGVSDALTTEIKTKEIEVQN